MSTSFTDTAGRTWHVQITAGSIKRVKSILEIDLMKILEEDGDLLGRLTTDPMLMVDVVYVLCKPQCDEKSVSDEQFGESMGGDAVDEAYRAMLEGFAGFFREPQRGLIRRMIQKVDQVMERAAEHVGARIDAVDMDKELASLLKTHGEPSGSVPESSG